MIRRFIALALGALAASTLAVTLGATAAPAYAERAYSTTVHHGDIGTTVTVTARTRAELMARSWAQCNAANDVCIWQNSNGNGGTPGWFAHWSHGWIYGQPSHCWNLPVGYRNGTSSAGNHSPYLVYLKTDLYCGGGNYTLYQGRDINTTGVNDMTDSILASTQP